MPQKETNILNLTLLIASEIGFILWKNIRGLFYDRQGNPRKCGLGPNGGSDTIGYYSTVITPAMVGKRVAIFSCFEVKTETGRASKEQLHFLAKVESDGGISGLIRAPEDIHNHLENSSIFN